MNSEIEGVHMHETSADPRPISLGSAGQLIVFSVVMLIGCYVAGWIPLYMSLSEKTLQYVSVLGAGLLLGTALAVIIPEGLQTLLSFSEDFHGIDGTVGAALVIGFLFMLLIDQIAAGSLTSKSYSDVENGSSNIRRKTVNWTTTLGLVVHAAADGIALGAAALTNQTDVELIVFFAIMLHKAPAAFGLVTFLLHEGLDRNQTRKHLLTFAFAAPVTALATFFLLYIYGVGDKGATLKGTGIAMLFSAGTFLYVATVHVLPEVTSLGHSHSHVISGEKSSGFSKMELLMLVIGMLTPLLITFGHHH